MFVVFLSVNMIGLSDMQAKRQRFDVGAMMKARKEAKLQHDKIVATSQAIAKKKGYLHNLKMKEKRLDCKVSFRALFEIFLYTAISIKVVP